MQESEDILSDSIVVSGYSPLQYTSVEENTDNPMQRQLLLETETVLRELLVYYEHSAPVYDSKSFSEEKAQSVLEKKLDLCISLIGHLSKSILTIPERREFKLASRSIEWSDHNEVGDNESVIIELYLDENFPRSIKLPARITGTRKENDGYFHHAEFSRLPDSLHSLLDKIIFRFHRQEIAAQKAAKPQ